MLNVLKTTEIRAAENEFMNKGVDEIFLRHNAALAIADGIMRRASMPRSRVAVFCGPGGNGIDGMLAAVRLHRMGKRVRVFIVSEPKDKSAKFFDVLSYAKNYGVEVIRANEFDGNSNILIDAVFGIGLTRPIAGETQELIDRLNAMDGVFRFAVDIPSGLDADSGKILGTAFKADVTMSFSCYKFGMLTDVGRDVCGKIVVEDVGIPMSSDTFVYTGENLPPLVRPKHMHKGMAGRVFVIGGSATMVGAPILAGAAAHAAYLNGAGVVTTCVPRCNRVSLSSRATLTTMKFLPDTSDGFIKFDKRVFSDIVSVAKSINIGMGMGAAPDLKKILEFICENFSGTLVIDADALNALSGDYSLLKGARPKTIITPHVGEFERLTGKSATIENAVALSAETGVITVLKSATTIVTDGKTVRLNLAGTPAMAKGGSGDLLGGAITALTCSFEPYDAAIIACYRQGLGAERAVSSYAELMLTPRDVLNYADYPELYD